MKSQDLFKKLARKYKTPKAVQRFLREFDYNPKNTLYSARTCFQKKEAHCLEAAFLAAAILEHCGYPPLVMSFESKDGLDHVIFIFKHKGKWGSIGRSRDQGLHGRAPRFHSLRSLAWSYFDPYIDKTGRVTAYQMVHLDDTKTEWRDAKKNLWKAERYLVEIKHRSLKSSQLRYKKIKARYLASGPASSGPFWW